MAIPAIPSNFNLQQANGEAFLSWAISPGATSYSVQRSTDGVSYSVVSSPTANSYLDTSVTVGVQYFYKVAATNSDGTSSYTNAQSCVPTLSGEISLGQIRLMAQQRADRVNSNFVTLPEWNSYISQSYFELYDLLISTYGSEYYLAPAYEFTTNGTDQQYSLPTDLYKLLGVDLGLGLSSTAFITIHNFNFIERNRYVYPQLGNTYLGVFNMKYRLMGDKLFFIPTPSADQRVRVWYVPKLVQPLADTDILNGLSGWLEYVIIDAAIKALQKEESDVSVLMAQKMAMKQRIESTAQNRDTGQSQTISDTARYTSKWGAASGQGDGSWGGI